MAQNESLTQISVEDNSSIFVENPEPRCPCLLLLDTSGSMSGDPISELNSGLQTFRDELLSDPLAIKRVEVAIITFGPVKIENNFVVASSFIPPTLQAGGDTPMGAAITHGIDLLKQRKKEYRENGISFYRPWIFMITDGAPTDSWREASNLIIQGEEKKSFAFFAVGVKNADMATLKQIAVREPLKLKGLQFQELFKWLSNSMRSVSQSVPDATVKLGSTSGWSEV